MSSMIRHKLLLSSLILTCSLNAAIFVDLDTTSLAECNLSMHSMNRIAVRNGRILKVVAPNSIQILEEDITGQVFVSPKEYLEDPVTISIVTNEGIVQDLSLKFSDIPSEAIFLSLPQSVVEKEEKVYCAVDDPIAISEKVSMILNGRIPDGYIASDAISEPYRIRNCIIVKNTAKFVGNEEIILIWEINNRGFGVANLHERDLNFCGGNWVYIAAKRLKPREKTIAIVSVKR